jgi:hypothetical protein
VREEGIKQVARYRNIKAPDCPSYLVIFDRRAETKVKPWDERLSWDELNGITVVCC